MADLLTESEGGETIEMSASPGVDGAVTEVRKRRGRPPGSKNRPREEKDGTLSVGLEHAIHGLFQLMAFVASWFGYEQTEDLTPDEAKAGAKAFTPIAAKIPWFANVAIWIGAPVWLLMTIRKKFARKGTDERTNENRPGSAGNPDSVSADQGNDGAARTAIG